MAEIEIKITYETLYELLRREKSRDTLQELSPTFYQDVSDYLKEKMRILADQQRKLNLFSISEREKVEHQLTNVKKILTDFYDRREKKIISMAINKSITNSHIVDTSNLLDQEKKMYEHLLGLLNHYRYNVFYSVMQPNVETPDSYAFAKSSNHYEMPKASVPSPSLNMVSNASSSIPALSSSIQSSVSAVSSSVPASSSSGHAGHSSVDVLENIPLLNDAPDSLGKNNLQEIPAPEDPGIQKEVATDSDQDHVQEPSSSDPGNDIISPDSIMPSLNQQTSQVQQSSQSNDPVQAKKDSNLDFPDFKPSDFSASPGFKDPLANNDIAPPHQEGYPKQSSSDGEYSKIVRFLTPLPKFVGRHGETYGPFDEEDIANLPEDIADLLVRKGKVESLTDGENG